MTFKSSSLRRLAIVAGVAVFAASGATAQSRGASIAVGRFSSEKSCSLYQESAGRSAMVVTPYTLAAASSWRTWLVRDCVDNFASIRASLEAALASSGKFVVKPTGAAYSITGRISDVGGDGGTAPDAPMPEGGFSVSSRQMFVNLDLSLKDAAGRTVYGVLLTKHLETGSTIKTSGYYSSSASSGQGLYTQLQHEVALAAARLIAFHITPLRVVGGDGRQVQLNYGSPLLTLGTMVQATSLDGSTMVRYTVTSSGPGSAIAEVDGDGDTSRITPGSLAVVMEADDPASNGRRMKRVELPE